LLAQNGEMLAKHSIDGAPTGREGNRAFAYAPHGFYPCRGEDEWIAIAVPEDEAWSGLQSVLADGVLRLDEVQRDPHIAVRCVMEEVDHLEVGVRKYPRLPLTVDGEPQWSTRATPLFAQHNREVFGDLLGMSDDELAGLYERDVIGDAPKEALRT
jgi:crotonobetainyl-CoA:carnitine CoA-transferase CaiB-like acyl-CoA transferase